MGGRPEAQPRAFGAMLRALRSTAGLAQEELAERADVSVRTADDLDLRARTCRGYTAMLRARGAGRGHRARSRHDLACP
jgi:hypothetical protein